MGFFKVGAVNISNTANGKRFTTNQLGSQFGYGKTFDVIPESQYNVQINCKYQGDLYIHVDSAIYTNISNLTVAAITPKMTVSIQIHDAKDGDYLMLSNIAINMIVGNADISERSEDSPLEARAKALLVLELPLVMESHNNAHAIDVSIPERTLTPASTQFYSKDTLNPDIQQVYVINLERRVDRMKHMEDILGKYNIKYKRIQAIDGNTLKNPSANIDRISSDYWNKYALGLVKSFNLLLDDAIENKLDRILVFEDDIILHEDFPNIFNIYYNQLHAIKQWDIIQLSGGNHMKLPTYVPTASPIDSPIKPKLFRTSETLGTYAMLLNSSCFMEFKKLCMMENRPLDICVAYLQKKLSCYMFYPGIVFPKENYSDIINKNTNYNRYMCYHTDKKLDALIK